jgi:hypothetical protein
MINLSIYFLPLRSTADSEFSGNNRIGEHNGI